MQQRQSAGHLDRLTDRAHIQGHVQARGLKDLNDKAFVDLGRKAGLFDLNGISARGEIAGLILARAIGLHGYGLVGALFGHAHGRVRNGCSLGIRNCAGYGSALYLGKTGKA